MLEYGSESLDRPSGAVRKQTRVQNAMVDLFNTKPVNDEGTDKFKDYAKSTKVYWIAAFCIIVGIGVSIATGIVVSILQADASLTETQLNRLQADVESRVLLNMNNLTESLRRNIRPSIPGMTPNDPYFPQSFVTFTMWGRSECAGETVYRGFVVGPSGNIGGSRGGPGPVVCLPENPLGSHNVEPQILPPIHLQPPAHTESGVGTVKTPCAVCELYFVHDVIVIPGRNECFGEWRREYVGYMVSFYGDSGISESVCLHESQSPRISTTVNSTMIDAPLMMHIGVRGVTNYISTLPLICSVCSR